MPLPFYVGLAARALAKRTVKRAGAGVAKRRARGERQQIGRAIDEKIPRGQLEKGRRRDQSVNPKRAERNITRDDNREKTKFFKDAVD